VTFAGLRHLALALTLAVLWSAGGALAQPSGTESGVNAWLTRIHEASRQRAYTGTFVVSAGAKTASAKIWHVCDGSQQMERVEPLSGPPRSTFRHDDQVITFFPESKVAVAETRESLGLFPNLLKTEDSNIGEWYQLKSLGIERMVGLESDVVHLVPKDLARYGYRIWSEKRTGLVLQLQTLDVDGKVLEQAAFSELQLDAPVNMAKLTKMMSATDGYRIERPDLQKTTAESMGWRMRAVTAGFKPAGCYLRPVAASGSSAQPTPAMQWMFSDGLANVSLFVEPFDARRHSRVGVTDLGGATRTATRHLDSWWITAVGEVPASTLISFAQALERRK
jgi:sigma-E factor negative regulatory protein RseB